MTNPGQSTPWAKIPVPSEGKVPDVPVDLAAVADAIDTVLKNVIGGSTAPTGPLQPSVIDASASIGSLNTTQSKQQAQITTLQGQVSALSVAPWAKSTSRTSAWSMPGTTKSATTIHSYQVPSFSQRRLLIVFASVILGWSVASVSTAVRTRLMVRADGGTAYVSRNWGVENGNDQAHHLFFLETVEAGDSVNVALAADVYGASVSNANVYTQSMDPRLYLIALPWTGSTVPYLPI
ncbi:hypothetical protein ACLGIH_20190 [Streptomyces sp. HMX87]|uniref:hypothetical protein n=1 Tax=Streptomyces sp. HMX87 TaxID=3390849 RepID=UPI003A85E7CF